MRLRATLALGPKYSAGAGYEAKMTERPPRGDIESDSSGNDGADDLPPRADGGLGATGQDLREQREALGADLVNIAETLCIRREFLEALEAGDYESLPGPAYAVGFVRSYAKHLGMDGDKMAWQFKVEISVESPTLKLDFLTPVQESRIPRGAVVLVMGLLAVAIYGVWYYMNARELTLADIIPEVPLQFGRTAEAPAPAPGAAVKGGAPARGAIADSSAPEPAEKGATAAPEGGAAGGDTASDPAAASGATPPSAAAMDRQGAVPSAPDEPVPADDRPGTAAAPPTPGTAAAPPTPGPAAEATAGTPPPAAADAAASPPSTSEEAAAVPSPAPAEPAPAVVSTRIEIRAKADSWVQVRTKGGTLLMTRILSKGTSFAVPPQEGLRLTTGNAGGLEILVDGVAVPSLGPFGAVRRDVALDPARLKAGTASRR